VCNNRLLARLKSLQKHLPCNRRQLRIVQRLNIQRRNTVEGRQLAGKRRIVPVNVVQITKTDLRGANHHRKPAQAVLLDSHFHHLFGIVVDGIEHQRANALVALRFAQRRVSSQVIAPQPETGGIQVVTSRQSVDGDAQLVGFAVTQRGNARVGAVRRKIKDEHIVLVVLQRGNQCQQFTAARFIAMTQDDCRRLPQAREKPPFPSAELRDLKNHHLRSAWKAGHADFRRAALRLDDSVDEKSRNGRRSQQRKKGQRQNQRQQFRVPPRWIPQFRKDVHASLKPLRCAAPLVSNSFWKLSNPSVKPS